MVPGMERILARLIPVRRSRIAPLLNAFPIDRYDRATDLHTLCMTIIPIQTTQSSKEDFKANKEQQGSLILKKRSQTTASMASQFPVSLPVLDGVKGACTQLSYRFFVA